MENGESPPTDTSDEDTPQNGRSGEDAPPGTGLNEDHPHVRQPAADKSADDGADDDADDDANDGVDDDDSRDSASDDSRDSASDDSRDSASDGADNGDSDANTPHIENQPGNATPPEQQPAPAPGSKAARSAVTTDGDSDTAGEGIATRFFHDQQGPLMWIREFLSSAAVVLAIGLLLFGISGVWPPMVAVESGSMEPNMEKGDLIFVSEPGRFAPDAATNDVGVVTHEAGQSADYETFGSFGSVIVFDEPGRVGSPIIHRAHFHVEEGENWYDRADDRHVRASSCSELRNCPAPATGFITKGDNNPQYDQAQGIAPVVHEEWITGVARLRIPYLGWIRLFATGQAVIFGGLSGIPTGTSVVAVGASLAVVGRETVRAS